jgi:hypothetical protein
LADIFTNAQQARTTDNFEDYTCIVLLIPKKGGLPNDVELGICLLLFYLKGKTFFFSGAYSDSSSVVATHQPTNGMEITLSAPDPDHRKSFMD